MRRGLRFVALLLFVAAIVAAGRTLVAQTPVFRAGVDLVQVDVVVTDAHDQPITDLTAADFTLTQDGRPQRIQAFQYISIPLAHRLLDPKQPPSPPADVATNAPASDKSRLFAIIIDDQHIIENDIVHVKQAITAFVQALSPDDEVAIVFTGRSDLSVNFTHDAARLLKAVDGVKNALGFGIDAKGFDPTGKMAKHEVLAHATTTIYALQNAIAALSGSGHVRRAIILVSGFSPLAMGPACGDGAVLQLDLEDAYKLARQADVPIYTLDPRGIPNDQSASRMRPGRAACTAGVAAQQAHLMNIAESTGGRAFMNDLDVPKLSNAIVDDNGSFYVLGYAPDPVVQDGKVHPIKVLVARPGARVRGRTEYVAPSPAAGPTSTQQALNTAIGRGVNVSGLTLHAFAAPVAATAKGMTTVVTIDVTYPRSGALPSALEDDLTVNVLALDPDAKIQATVGNDWHVSAIPNAGRDLTVRVNEVLDLPPRLTTLRIGVASPAVGREGTIQLPLDVPNPSHGKLQVGGIVLGVAADRSEAAGFARLHGLVPFQPTTSRTFTPADTIRVFAPLFWSTKDPTVDVRVETTGARPGASQQTTLTGALGPSGQLEAKVDVTLPLKDLSPGACTISVKAHLASAPDTIRIIPCTIELPR